MAETITIAGKTLPKTYVYIGGAVVVGVVGYAWWTRGGGAVSEEPEVLPAVDEFGDERITPTTIDTYDVAVDTRSGVKTNAEWKQAADAYLSGLGYDSTVVSTALGRFLARQRLNKVDVEIARQAWGSFGEPPEGRPWFVLETEATPAAVAPGAITNLRVVSTTPTSITIAWDSTPGASGYEVRRDGGGTARKTTTSHTSTGLAFGHNYTFRVRSYNSANNFGPEATVTGHPSSPTAGSGGIGAPARVGAAAEQSAKIGVIWSKVPGAVSYRLRREGSGPGVTSGWVTVGNKTGHVLTARFTRPTQVRVRVQAMGPGGKPGGNTLSNAVVVKP